MNFAAATATRLALVIVRTLAFSNPGTPSSHATNPNNRSATAVLVPGMAMIFATHFLPEFTSDVHEVSAARNLRLTQLAQKFYVIFVLLSALHVPMLVRPNSA